MGETFPKDFVWGAATSSYQIEGATKVDGRGDSIWDVFANRSKLPGGPSPFAPGAAGTNGKWTFENQSGEPACDHYLRYKEDVALMREIGLRAYRFSVAWPRVVPDESGRVNEKGLAFYDRLVDELLGAGIEPWLTLYHWDMPAWVWRRGGWLNRETAELFARYSEAVVDRLSDRVTKWMTINEPQVFCKFGYGDGFNAPGLRLGIDEQMQAVHVALLAHGRGCQVIRARAKKKPTVGWALVGRTDFPMTESAADIEAARASMMDVTTPDLWNNTWYADPAVFGRYPEDGLKLFAPAEPDVRAGDTETIKQPLDFYGVNIYDGRRVRAGKDGKPEVVPFDPGHPQTMTRWFIAPEALRWGPRFLWERYKVPIYITENGMSGHDWVHEDGRVHDMHRIDYLKRYLREFRKAGTDGADIRGYFQWSLLDNYEWSEGYQQRFGLIHVDVPTGKRTVKESGKWYKGVIESNGGVL